MSKTNSDDLQTVIYVLAALATIATFILTFGPALARRIEERRASEAPEPLTEVLQPSDSLATPPASTDVDSKFSEMKDVIGKMNVPNSSDAHTNPPREEKQSPDIKIECDKASIVDGDWYWGCYLRNNSKNTIWWKEYFQSEGSQLGWYCLESGEQACTASTLSDDEIKLSGDSIRFSFLNPGEAINFWISCPQEPFMCGVHGRAPGLVIEEASFSRHSE